MRARRGTFSVVLVRVKDACRNDCKSAQVVSDEESGVFFLAPLHRVHCSVKRQVMHCSFMSYSTLDQSGSVELLQYAQSGQ